MKIKSNIDEVVCTGVSIGDGPSRPITAEFGYLAGGMRCGHVEIVGIVDDDVTEKVAALVGSVEKYFAKVVGEPEEAKDKPRDIQGLVPKEF